MKRDGGGGRGTGGAGHVPALPPARSPDSSRRSPRCGRADRPRRADRRRRAGRSGMCHRAGPVSRGATATSSNIGVLEKAAALGEHSLSGAVVNPRAFRELFPDLNDSDFPFRGPVGKEAVYLLTGDSRLRLPTPPTMHNDGHYIASLCEIVRWLGAKAEGAGRQRVHRISRREPAHGREPGARACAPPRAGSTATGRRWRTQASAPTDLSARVTALAEGTRGLLVAGVADSGSGVPSRESADLRAGRQGNLGDQAAARHASCTRSAGRSRPMRSAGASCIRSRPISSRSGWSWAWTTETASSTCTCCSSGMKLHPLFRQYLEGGEMVEWGAKTIPEGGYYSVPARRSRRRGRDRGRFGGLRGRAVAQGNSLRDAVRHVRRAHDPRRADSRRHRRRHELADYDRMVNESFIMQDLNAPGTCGSRSRTGFYAGGVKAGLMTLTGGRFPGGKIAMDADADVPRASEPRARARALMPDGKLTFRKVDARVQVRERDARHDSYASRSSGRDIPAEVADFYSHMCPAGVYEVVRRTPAGQRAQLYRLQSHRCVGAALDTARRGERAEVPADVSRAAIGRWR